MLARESMDEYKFQASCSKPLLSSLEGRVI